MNIRKLLKMYITSLSVLATLFAPTAVFYDAQSSVLSFFERVGGGSANTSIKGFAFEEDTDRPLHMLPDIAPLRFFPTPVDIISPYYTTYGGDGGKEQAMVRFVV
jgi:hypothetical protein